MLLRHKNDKTSTIYGKTAMKSASFALGAAFVLAFAAPALAHHSFAMFDLDPAHVTTMNGTVKELEWVNPHAWLHIVAKNKAGVAEEWSFEMGSPGQLTSKGWSKDVIKPGDVIAVSFHPMKDGSHGGNEITVKTANGTILGGQPTTGR